MFSFQRFPRPVVFRRTKLLRLPREREVKEVDEEMHENDEEISHHRTGKSVQVSNHSGRFFTKGWLAYLLLIRKIWMIKLFMNKGQIRLLNSKTIDLDWYYSRPNQKLKFLILQLLFMSYSDFPLFSFLAKYNSTNQSFVGSKCFFITVF